MASTAALQEPEDVCLEEHAADDSDSDVIYVDRPTRPARKKRKKNDDKGNTFSATVGGSSFTAVSLQPLLDFLASKYASADCDDTTFDSVAGSILAQYAERRDELEQRHGRDDLGRPYLLLSSSEEVNLIGVLEARSQGSLTVSEALILRKLKLQRHLRTHDLPRPLLQPKNPVTIVGLAPTVRTPEPDPEVLRALYDSPLVVAVDWEVRSPWIHLMADIRAHYALKLGVVQESVAPIMYVTLTAEHLPQVHDILHRSFWSGIDVSDSLQHFPEQATIVAVYKSLVVGCAILSSPVETYITYLAVRAGWENAQIATAMLFHLINRNPNKDITLHVSTNSPAMLLYNRFGFKAEEFIVGFYEAYLDRQSRMSKNAFRLRLRR
ncbi:hypothetical protein F5148DRAFT_658941 [Russula earlei]|uniref:Uncharacterized protein n=1 Tax=Russula earlei TaxID=71964 RepID=A0ACC0UEH3_9AGAM|nr:hypothetical protein F5148DRAFT_658941 [Russula earlei]